MGGATCVPEDRLPREIEIFSDLETYGLGTLFDDFTNEKNHSNSASINFPWWYRHVYDTMPKNGEYSYQSNNLYLENAFSLSFCIHLHCVRPSC